MTAAALDCWKCGAVLAELILPVGRAEYCRACRAEVHVCRMCRFYDVTKAKQCAEPVADPVSDKERSNFCGYFEPVAGRFRAPGTAANQALDALNSLFGPKK